VSVSKTVSESTTIVAGAFLLMAMVYVVFSLYGMRIRSHLP
jgi:hypothetical protein